MRGFVSIDTISPRIRGSIALRNGLAAPTRSLLITAIFVALSISPCQCMGKAASPSFSKTMEQFHEVSKDRSSTRDQWLRVVHGFLSTYEIDKRSERGRRSLFLAGKSALDLYRRSGNAEDLDEAINCLNAFNSIYRRGPYHIPALQALKEADLLKRGADNHHREKSATEMMNVERTANDEQSNLGHASGSKPPPREVDSVAADDTEPGSGESGAEVTSARRPYNCTGNPFFREFNKPSTDDSKPAISASLIPDTVTDVSPGRPTDLTRPRQTVSVVIDPGHGGKDPGAVSADSLLKEKAVTLDIAERTKRKIEEQLPGTLVVLTRKDDRFLALEDRTALANATNSDLFLSIHCNADTDEGANGVETYFLSKTDSRQAIAMAARENGIPTSQISDLQATLLDLMITSKKAESVKLAHLVHDSVIAGLAGKMSQGRDRGIKPAPLYILLGARMPAIMVECGFVSNRNEKRNLARPEYRDAVAQGIAQGAVKYLKTLAEKEDPGS